MKTTDVLPFFNNSKSQLARALGITRQAVNNWGEHIPLAQELRLRYEVLPEHLPRRIANDDSK